MLYCIWSWQFVACTSRPDHIAMFVAKCMFGWVEWWSIWPTKSNTVTLWIWNLTSLSPPQDRFCPVCTELLTEPFLSDCGHHVCRECHKRIMASGNMKCPTCQEPNVLKTARLNKHLQREIYDLKVRCKHHKAGCKWVRELRDLKDHLDPVRRKCRYHWLQSVGTQ